MAKLEVSVFGQLTVSIDSTPVPLRGKVLRRIFVALVLARGRVVTIAALADAAWGDRAPATSNHQVRKAIASLRAKISFDKDFIITEGAGYYVDLSITCCDLVEFHQHISAAREIAAQDPTSAATHYQKALDLFAPILDGEGGEAIEATEQSLLALHDEAASQCCETLLASGDFTAALSLAEHLASKYPLQENFQATIIRALCKLGRQADALQTYETYRVSLADEFGVDPGKALQELHNAVLTENPALQPDATQSFLPSASPSVHETEQPQHTPVCTLPRRPPLLRGRSNELDAICKSPNTSVVAVTGIAGAGKTYLAVEAAYVLSAQYPDGQLYLDMAAYRRGTEPLSVTEGLTQLLEALGFDASRLPTSVSALIDRWRSETRHRALVLVLDDAVDAGQVLPFLPGGENCATIITSRRRVSELDPDLEIHADGLAMGDAIDVLLSGIASPVSDSHLKYAEEVCQAVSGLPLALRILNAKLTRSRSANTKQLFESMQSEGATLAVTSGGQRSVSDALRLSLADLPPDVSAHAILLSWFPTPKGLSTSTAAAWLDLPYADAQDVLWQLCDAHWITETSPDFWQVHDLVQTFLRTHPTPDLEAATARLGNFATYVCDAMFTAIRPTRNQVIGEIPGTPQYASDSCNDPQWIRQHKEVFTHLVSSNWAEMDPERGAILGMSVIALRQLMYQSPLGIDFALRVGDLATSSGRDDLMCLQFGVIANNYSNLQLTEEAHEALTKSNELQYSIPTIWFRNGHIKVGIYRQLGQLNKAVSLTLELTNKLDRKSLFQRQESLHLYALLLAELGRHEEALSAYDDCIKVIKLRGHEGRPSLLRLYIAKGEVLLTAGNTQMAAEQALLAEAAIAYQVDQEQHSRCFAFSALCHCALGNHATYASIYEKCIKWLEENNPNVNEIDQSRAQTFQYLAISCYIAGHFEESLAHISQIQRILDPTTVDNIQNTTLVLKAATLQKLNRNNEADKCALEARQAYAKTEGKYLWSNFINVDQLLN